MDHRYFSGVRRSPPQTGVSGRPMATEDDVADPYLVGYARVSKGEEQSTAAQSTALKAAGCRRLFEEAASGGCWDRPVFQDMLRQLREGDVVVVWKLDRLTRTCSISWRRSRQPGPGSGH